MTLTQEWKMALMEYGEKVRDLEKNRRFFDGVLGFGKHPSDDPCHEVLDRKAESLAARAGEGADPEDRENLILAVLAAAAEYEGPEYARLMLCAAQRHLEPLIPRMDPAARAEAARWYEKTYPRRGRMPVQEALLKKMKK